MAEILLSLTIIGVVAAITLPSLTGNINERTWNTQRKALFARMSQAISLMPSMNGYGVSGGVGSGSSMVADNATETFLTAGLSKVLKINNICDHEHVQDCGIVSTINTMAGSQLTVPLDLYTLDGKFSNTGIQVGASTYSTPNYVAAAFETQNGESIITYYNANCRTMVINDEHWGAYGIVTNVAEPVMCANFIYDLNGSKGPNTVGKDIGFMTVFNASDSIVVAPMPSSITKASEGSTWSTASSACTTQNSDSRLPNIDEASSLLINKNLIGLTGSESYWSSSVYDATRAWSYSATERYAAPKTQSNKVRCIKR